LTLSAVMATKVLELTDQSFVLTNSGT